MPPFTAVAVKVTDVPGTTGFAEAAMVTLTATLWLTIIVMALEVAGFPETQDNVEVKTQVTTSDCDGT